MHTFEEILRAKLGDAKEEGAGNATVQEASCASLNRLNLSSLSQKVYYKLEDSSYSIYKKSKKDVENQRKQREQKAFEMFTLRLTLENERVSARFFYEHGARSFMDFTIHNLKKDYKKLAFSLHPDRHFHEIPSVQEEYKEKFKELLRSYEVLRLCFLKAK